MDDVAEKRVYADRAGATLLVVAAAPGLVSVSVAGGRVGEFGVARDCVPTDVAAGDEGGNGLAVATDADVLLAESPDPGTLDPSGFGPAAGVTIHGSGVVAAAPAGRVGVHDGAGWHVVGELPAPPAGLAGDLIGTRQGVVRLVDGELRPAGLADVNDVARAARVPLAATADGLYELGNGWLDVLDGDVRRVAGAPDGRAHAATADACYARGPGGWERLELPIDDPVAAVAYGSRTYLLTAAGDLLVETTEGWARTPLGLDGVAAAAVLRTEPPT